MSALTLTLYKPLTHGGRARVHTLNMKTKIMLFASLLLLPVAPVRACGATPELLSTLAVSENSQTASNAAGQLRRLGREGFDALLKTHAPLLARHGDADPQWLRLRAALDVVSGQKDCHASRLFWHTNIADAKAEAQQTGKPILSLRLLGHLDEELSCANSRFFRTTLYANAEVSAYLREHYVLHWKSVRPVPRITIDMGDGRKIERTITGNSIHYVLDANGDVVDALPGLYGPRAFLTGLKSAEPVAQQAAKMDSSARARLLENYHTTGLAGLTQRWGNDLAQVGVAQTASVALKASPEAMQRTVTKTVVERPMMNSFAPRRAALERSMDDELWTKIAALHRDDATLDPGSIALIRAKTRPADEAMRLAFAKSRVEDPMLKTVQNLQRSIAEDTVRNEYLFHAKIHEWLAAPGATREVDALNRRVYAELFLTPDTDPWLGLAPSDTFSALEGNGLKLTADRAMVPGQR